MRHESAGRSSETASRSPVLRPMTLDDLDEMVEVQREAAVAGLSHIFPQDENPFPTADVTARWAREVQDPDIDCFVILDESQHIAGFAATKADELLHFGTALHTWGSGLAGRAHDAVIAHVHNRGFTRPWLRVFADNLRARRFYERRGWAPTGEHTRTSFPPHPVLLHYTLDPATGPDAHRSSTT